MIGSSPSIVINPPPTDYDIAISDRTKHNSLLHWTPFWLDFDGPERLCIVVLRNFRSDISRNHHKISVKSPFHFLMAICESWFWMRYFMCVMLYWSFTFGQSTSTMKYGKKTLSCVAIVIPINPDQRPRSTNIKMSILLPLSGMARVFFSIWVGSWGIKWRHWVAGEWYGIILQKPLQQEIEDNNGLINEFYCFVAHLRRVNEGMGTQEY